MPNESGAVMDVVQCSVCGQTLQSGHTICQECGKKTSVNATTVQTHPSQAAVILTRKIRTLAFCWLAVAAYETWGAYLAFNALTNGSSSNIPKALLWFSLVSMMAKCVLVPLSIVASIGLLNLQGWARTLSITVAIMAFPSDLLIGSAMGIWTLIVLLNKNNTETLKALTSSGV